MNQKLLRTVSMCALIAAFSGAAVAQTGGAGGGGAPGGSAPQTQQRMPDSGPGDAGRGAQSQGGGETTRPKSAQPKGDTSDTPRPGSAQRDDSATPRKQDRSDTKGDQKRTPQASDSQRKDDGKRASDSKQENDRARADELQRDRDRDRARAGKDDRGQDKDRTRSSQDKSDRSDRSRQGQADRGKDADRGTQLSEQQRTNVRERFQRSGGDRNRVSNVNFDIRVGANVPRSVTLHTLPVDVVEVVPQYRGYRYVYVNDDIVIVNPSSYAVVAVLSGGGSRAAGPRASRLTLAAPARTFVRDHIDRGASIRLGIGAISIGMSIPQGVSLLPMPTVVVDRYPELQDYRYFVYEDDIAIVDPATDEVVLIVQD